MEPYDLADLADRMLERQRAGGDMAVFDVELDALNPDEMKELATLTTQRAIHGHERLEAATDRMSAFYEIRGVLAVHGCRTLMDAVDTGAISEDAAVKLFERASGRWV